MRRFGTALVAVLTVLTVLVASLLVGRSAGAAPPAQVVRPGGIVTVVGTGFAPGAAVSVRLVGTRGQRTVHADRHGRVSTTYRAPRQAGHYQLLLVGVPPISRVPTPTPVRGRGDHQVLTVLVPRLVTVPFVVRIRSAGPGGGTGGGHSGLPGGTESGGTGSGGTGSAGTGSGGTGSGGAGPRSGGAPAVTGTDLAIVTALAAALVVAGCGLVLAVRRRRT